MWNKYVEFFLPASVSEFLRGSLPVRVWKGICRLDRWFLDLLYPPRCPVCDKVVLAGEGLCSDCRNVVQKVGEPACMKCGKPLGSARKEFCFDCGRKKHSFQQGKALWVYEKGVRGSIYRFKYQNRREYGRVYAAEIAKQYAEWIWSRKIQGIVPVPLHRNRKKRRGYNQAEVLARELGEILGIPVYTDVLIRVRDTKPQKVLNDAERKYNLKNAFKTGGNVVQLQYVLIVDDIYTTGSTLDAAAAALLLAGVLEVYVCCISIGTDG